MLNEKSPSMNIPENEFNIIFKPHQKALLYKALKIDNDYKNKPFNYGMFSDPPGSGKTFVILAFIYYIKIFENNKKNCFLIVVPNNIFYQWIDSINKIYKTKMNCLFITENKDINEIYSNKYILHNTDIILITPILYSSLVQSTTCHKFCFRSVFFDEVDTIKNLLNYNIYSQMFWFISASIQTIFDEKKQSVSICSKNLNLIDLKNNNCCCEMKYIKKCMNIKKPNYKEFVCKNVLIDNVFQNFCTNKIMKYLYSHDFNKLTNECGDVDLSSFQDVLKNLYIYNYKLLKIKMSNIEEIEKHIKFPSYNTKNFISQKNKLIQEYNYYKNIVNAIKNESILNFICIKCFQQIQEMTPENEYKNDKINYYITPCDNYLCYNCVYEIIENIDCENVDNDEIKIECLECNEYHKRNDLILKEIHQNNNPYLNLDKISILSDILDICKNKILLFSSSRKQISFFLENYYENKMEEYVELNGGNVNDLINIINNFKNDDNIKLLFINDLSLSNGLNLEFVDDLILFNLLETKIVDQVVGRVLRFPRIKKLNIYQLKYKNEK